MIRNRTGDSTGSTAAAAAPTPTPRSEDPCAVSGWAALNHHGLTEQIPRLITLTTPKRVVTPAMRGAVRTAPSTWEVAGQRYEIVTIVPAHFFGCDEVWMGESRVRIFDSERALLDCFALPRRFGGLAEGLAILEEHGHTLDLGRLVGHAQRYGKAAVAKRVGYGSAPSCPSCQAVSWPGCQRGPGKAPSSSGCPG